MSINAHLGGDNQEELLQVPYRFLHEDQYIESFHPLLIEGVQAALANHIGMNIHIHIYEYLYISIHAYIHMYICIHIYIYLSTPS
jgi:hypothetical protein